MGKARYPAASSPRVIFVGNFLEQKGKVPQVCEDLSDLFEQKGWSVLRTSSRSGRGARLVDMVTTTIRRNRDYDVAQLDVFSGSAFVWAEAVALALRALRKPYVLTLHGGRLPEFASRNPGRVRRLLERAASVTCPSTYLAERMRKFRGEFEILPNPLDLAEFEFEERSEPTPSLIWLRAFHSLYRPWLAVEVLGRLATSRPNARLSMYGPDSSDGSRSRTEETVERLGLEKLVSVRGPISRAEVPKSLQTGDIFLNTSSADNTPRSVIEAMACGLCVVSSNVGGIPHLIDDGVNGLLVDGGDPIGMTRAVIRMLEDPGLAKQLSRNARVRAEQSDWTRVVPRWEKLFNDLASSAREARLP